MARPTQDLLANYQHHQTGPAITIDDVVVKSAGWLAYALVFSLIGWATAGAFLATVGGSPLLLLVAFVGLAFLDYRICKAPTPPMGLMALSLGLYGYFVGAVSALYASASNDGIGLIGAAATGTVAVAVAVIVMFKVGIIKANTPKFRTFMLTALAGYGAVVIVSLLLQVLGMNSLFGPGVLGWVLCLVGASLAALSLTLAAADIDTAIRQGAPAVEASRLAWAFISTLMWLYLEVLRLLARMRD